LLKKPKSGGMPEEDNKIKENVKIKTLLCLEKEDQLIKYLKILFFVVVDKI
jgi:hypothetical protein